KTMALWAVLVVIVILLYQMYDHQARESVPNFDYQKFITALENKEIKSVTFRGESGIGEISGDIRQEFIGKYGGRHFSISGNIGDGGYREVVQRGLIPNYERAESGSLFQTLAINWLPLIFIFAMFMFFMRQIQVGGGKAMSFGKSRARLL